MRVYPCSLMTNTFPDSHGEIRQHPDEVRFPGEMIQVSERIL